MIFRKYQKEDYKILEEWYDKWFLPHTPEHWIPETTYLVYDGELPICCGSVYQLGKTPMFLIEGILSDPWFDNDKRKDAINFLIKNLSNLNKELNCEMLLTSTPRTGLMMCFMENNFKPAPEQYSHLARVF